jgi:hypothetical protein
MRKIFIVLFILGACAGKKHESQPSKRQNEAHDFIFRMQLMYTDQEDEASFPVWFNEEMIAKQKISSITQTIYETEIKDAPKSLREKRQYYFNRNGMLRCVVIRSYYDDEQIGLIRYDYPTGHDAMGFGQFHVVKDTSRLDFIEDANVPELKSVFYPFSIGKDLRVFRNGQTGRRRYYYPKRRIEKVDSIPEPQLYDQIVMGTVLKPTSNYFLGKDKIKVNLTRYIYSKKTGAIARILFYRGPITTKRNFDFNSKGKCTGFIDSTFTNSKFLCDIQTTFILNGAGNPTKVNTFKRINDKPTILQTEQFLYEHF